VKARQAIALALLALGCGAPPQPASTEVDPQSVRVIAVATDGTTSEVVQRIRPDQLVGEYSTFGLTGIRMDLQDGGNFEGTSWGCMGDYSKWTGRWKLSHKGVEITTQDTSRPAILAAGTLPVISWNGHLLLLAERNRDLFAKYGIDSASCYHQRSARTALENSRINRKPSN
jgi:hypothetical protein